jgi:hypothetical protein
MCDSRKQDRGKSGYVFGPRSVVVDLKADDHDLVP